jgi:WD40 repeat protein
MGGFYDLVTASELDDGLTISHINTEAPYTQLECSGTLTYHTGCVNSLEWSEDGATLVSGADDGRLCIWSYETRSLLTAHNTGHTGNIFSVRYLPTTSDHLITVAGDSLVKYHQIRDDGHVETLRVWDVHRDRAKKIETEPGNPHLFLTCSEDGTIHQFDLRTPEESSIVANWGSFDISLNSMSIAPLRPYLLAAAGTGPIVRLIDRRFMTNSSFSPSDTPIQGSREAVWIPNRRPRDMVTSVRFSAYSMDLLCSILNDSIYRVNADAIFEGRYRSHADRRNSQSDRQTFLELEAREYAELSRKWQEGNYSDCYFAIGTRVREHRSLQYATVPLLQSILAYETYNKMLCAVKIDKRYEVLTEANFLINKYADENKIEDECLNDPYRKAILRLAIRIYDGSVRNIQTDEESEGREENGQQNSRLNGEFEDYDPHDEEVDDGDGHQESRERLGHYLHNSTIESILAKMDKDDKYLDLNEDTLIDIPKTVAWATLRERNSVCTEWANIYSGHANVQTVKDVHFAGPRHEFVASGSDGGFFFIWGRGGGDRPIFIGRSDTHVVNQVVENPLMPVFAVSGIDHDIKIWESGGGNANVDQRWKAVPKDLYNHVMENLRRSATIPYLAAVPCPVQ